MNRAMEKASYIEQEFLRLTKYWISFALIVGAVFFMVMSALDYFVNPHNFHSFFIYRLSCASLMILLHFINKKISTKQIQYIIIISAAVLTSSTVELMILSSGGHQSTYLPAGLIITIVFLLGILPIPFQLSLTLVSIAYSIYLIPILLFDRITNFHIFVNNNSFLLATFMIAIIWRILSQKSLINELGLQYELDRDKHKLETYSQQLEALVRRTKRTRHIGEVAQVHF